MEKRGERILQERRSAWRSITLLVLLDLCALATGCSTLKPVQQSRWGLFDRGEPVASGRGIASIRQMTGSWQWPLRDVSVTSGFGSRFGSFHEGVDLRAGIGTPVHAANSGTVVYSDSKIRGYGRMVVLRHPDGLMSVYAHHQRNLVRVGQRVRQGQVIAYSGKSGRVSGPHLHFEIRDGDRAIDPQRVLRSASTTLARR